jgi:beta-lactamase regulating signal transducer with metallopeptidase domain
MSASATVLASLLSIAVKVTVLVVLAAAVDHAIMRRRASASARHVLWSVTLGAALMLPLAGWLLPTLSVPLPAAMPRVGSRTPPAREVDISVPARPVANPPSEADRIAASPQGDATEGVVGAISWSETIEAPSRVRAFSSADIMVAAYLAGVLLLLGRVLAEQRVVRRLERSATPLRDVEWHALFYSVADDLGIRRRVAMLHGAGNTMPLTWGVRHPAVLIPATAAEWPESRRRAVLLHELAHVIRQDCLTQTLAAITCALYWPHPGIWWAAHRLRIERELACDDQALLAGIGAHEYAGHLLEIARLHRVPAGLRALAVSMAARSHLEARLLAAVDGARRRAAPSRARRAFAGAVAALLLIPLAALHGDAAPAAAAPREAAGVAVARSGEPGSSGATATSGPDSLSAPAAAAAAHAMVSDFEGEWAMRLATEMEIRSQGEGNTPHVHMMLWDPGLNTFLVRLDAIEGLSAAQIGSSVRDARFTLRRDAGTFAFTGTFAGGHGRGRFVFTPSAAFGDSLERRGMERPTPTQQFSLARHGMNLDFLDELAKHGYARPSTSTFVRSGLTSTDVSYVREMGALGYRLGTLDALMRMANQGVTPGYVRELAALGYRGLTAEELVRLQNHSLDAPRVSETNTRAGRRLGVEELVAMRVRGDVATVDVPATVTRTSEAPASTTPAAATSASKSPAPSTPTTPRSSSTPLDGRWMIGPWRGTMVKLDLEWSDNNQWRRALPLADLHGVTAEQIAASKASSVSFTIDQDAGRFEFDGIVGSWQGTGQFHFVPNHEFVKVLRALGIRELGEVSDHELKNLAFGGMSATAVRGFGELGIGELTKDDIIEMAIRMLTPQYVRDLRAAGVTGTDTLRNLIEVRFHGVTPEYVREMAELGYGKLSTRELTELWSAGVSPAVIKGIRAAGERSPSKEELIQRAEEAKSRARRARSGR